MSRPRPHSRVISAVCWRHGLLICMAWFALAGVLSAAEPLWSVARLNESKGDWPILTSTNLRVEGRVASRLKGQFRFQHCSLTFLLSPELERRMTQARNVEVTGRLRVDGGSLVFDVSELSTLPTDIEHFRSLEAALRNPQPDDWYELGKWARERGRFYKDDDLLEAALSCFARGVGTELARLPGDDFSGRFALAKKSEEFGLPAKLSDEIRHEGYRTWWLHASSAARQDPDMLVGLEQQLRKDWPDALAPGSPFPTELLQQYSENPTDSYRQANDSQRQTLRRIFAADVQLRRLKVQLADDGRNGGEIAEQVERLVPERKAVANEFRNAALMYRLGQVGTSSKADALELAEAFRERQRPKEASEALLRWIVAKEQRLRPRTAPEFLELADEYLTLLDDESRAVALLIEAHRREPESPLVLSRFEQLGYVYNGIAWSKPQTLPLPTMDPRPTAAPAQLTAGMSMLELTKMLGEPTRRSRIVTGTGTDEFWVYGQVGEGSRLVIEFHLAETRNQSRVSRFYHR